MADVKVRHQCCAVVVEPLTSTALDWLEKNLGSDKSPYPHWPMVSFDPRHAARLLSAMESHGLRVQF